MALILLHLPTLALNAVTTLVYPLYSSYKAVTDSQTTVADMESWLVYWSVYAVWTLVETMFGFMWSWIPFYYEIRLAFNIWLVAPQTKGAMYLYVNHLHPLLKNNQSQIDDLIEHGTRGLRGKAQEALGNIWGVAAAAAGTTSSSGAETDPAAPAQGRAARHAPPGMGPVTGSTPAPPTQHNPVQAPLSLLGGLFRQYAPAALATAKQMLETNASESAATPYNIPSSSQSTSSAAQRRKELERQLAALDTPSSDDDSGSTTPVTLMPNKPRASFGNIPGLRNRQQPSSTGATIGRSSAKTVKGPLGESYDLLDQLDSDHSPQQPQQRRSSKGGWMPWSPSNNSPQTPPSAAASKRQ